jgi:DNA polymerase elongation subunit (family B)
MECLPKSLQRLYDKDSLVYQDDNTIYYNIDVDKKIVDDINSRNFQIYNGTYLYEPDYDSPIIYLVGRGRNCGKAKIKIQGFLPYNYVKSKDGDYKTYLGEIVDKIFFHLCPTKVGEYRRQCEKCGRDVPYESDILFCRRFLIDTYNYFKPTEYVNPEVCIMDVETDFPYDNNKMISFAINGYSGELYFNSIYDTENYWELILDAYEHLLKYDIWANWNVDFDYKVLDINLLKLRQVLVPARNGYELSKDDYIREVYSTFKKFTLKGTDEMVNALLNMDYLIIDNNGYIRLGDKDISDMLDLDVYPFDLLSVTKKMIAREVAGRWTLDNIGIQTCGIGKVEYEKKYVRDLDQETLFEYNVMDVIIPEIIDNEYGGIECHVILAWDLQQMIKDILITAVVNDIAMLREYHRDGIVLHSRPQGDEDDEETYKAAEPDARPGIYHNVIAFDLNAAYPSAVLAINASCESKDPDGKYIAPNGIRFNDKESTFIKTLKGLMESRAVVKKELKTLEKGSKEWRTKKFIDFALKTQVAAFSHGIFGWSKSRMKDKAVADAITSTVRGILDSIKDKADEIGYPWCYVHTDSCYISAPKEKQEELHKIFNDTITEHCELMGYSYIPRLDYKGFYPKAYIHSPARNVLVDEDGNWEVTGMSYMRSETPKPLSDIEIELIRMKLDEKSNNELIDRLVEMIDDLKTKDSTELGIIKPLNKKLESYGKPKKDGKVGSIPYHITALKNAQEDNEFDVAIGEKFCVIPIMTDETEGVRVKKRKRVFMAYDIDEGLPEYFEIDWENYLRSNLFGKICKLVDMKPKELENVYNMYRR